MPVESKISVGATPLEPAETAFQNSSQPIPIGETTPIPVTTTSCVVGMAKSDKKTGDFKLIDARQSVNTAHQTVHRTFEAVTTEKCELNNMYRAGLSRKASRDAIGTPT